MTANNKQVGGTHYQTEGSMQHWDIVYEFLEGDYLLGNATKYIFRCCKKGGRTKAIEDLQKAIHYLEKAIEVIKADRDSVNDGETTAGHVNQD